MRWRGGHALALIALLASCTSAPPVRTGRASETRSAPLRQTARRLARPFRALRESAPGLHWLTEDERDGRVGRTYRVERHRLTAGPTELALERMVRDILRPDPQDFVFYANATAAGSRSAATFQSALRLRGDPILAAELVQLHALARHLASSVPSSLVVYIVEAGWADAVGSAHHGIALVDPATSEALWIHVLQIWTV